MSRQDLDMIKQGKDPFSGPGALAGKSSVSKRHLKKKRTTDEEDQEDAGSDQVITRLQV